MKRKMMTLKMQFIKKKERVIANIPSNNVTITIGDANTKVGRI